MRTIRRTTQGADRPGEVDSQVVLTARAEPGRADAPAHEAPTRTLDRYEDLGRIGRGGMSEIRRVRDRVMGRVLAMKIQSWDHDTPRDRARFLAEARLTATLQHPGIVPVHDCGELPDGRLWFTMKEVRGRTLRLAVADAYEAGGGRPTSLGLRRLIDTFVRVAEAVAYAHSHGVVHRDLKPDNVMIGEFGEVLVMDWGLARPPLGSEPRREPVHESTSELASESGREPAPSAEALEIAADAALPADADHALTQVGEVLGTLAYMPPEQARGDRARLGPASDVYALGAVLYEILAGRPPFVGSAREAWAKLLAGPPEPVEAAAKHDVPAELAAITARAMARSPDDRHPDAGALAAEVRGWLDGAQRRERALAILDEARAIEPEIDALRGRASHLRDEARALLGALRTFDPVDTKARGWRLEDEAAQIERDVSMREVRWMQTVRSALNEVPDLPEAHALLADHYAARLLEAEAARDGREAGRAEALLRLHDRGRHATILVGHGALTLMTDPPGAEVTLYRHVERDRRLVPELVEELGPTPIVERSLPRGSYLLKVRAPGFAELGYPVLIERGQHAGGVRPGESAPHPIQLLRANEIGPDEVYVPAGWFLSGGDPDAGDGLPRRRLWVDGFIVHRHPVTNEDYLAFLNALIAAGREAEALAACPRMPLGRAAVAGSELRYVRGDDGRFYLGIIQADVQETPRMPVAFVDWWGATQYAAWFAATSGEPHRLLDELEWEKAARGVDGRFLPWGDFYEPTWACTPGSHAGVQGRVPIDDYPIDESPYGVRGTAGNVRDWCRNAWTIDGPRAEGDLVRLDEAEEPNPEFRSIRGGAWAGAPITCRLAARMVGRPGDRFGVAGFRLARSVGRR